MIVPTPPIITTDEWDARPPRRAIEWTGAPHKIIFHHTAGHHPEIANPADESRAEAIAYARAIQHLHMDVRGWNDSGHNFLVCRGGWILVGRHESFTAIERNRMVISAHCPGQNDQPGIEHEHLGNEWPTALQLHASAWLHAWIIDRCRMRSTGTIHPHREYYPTSCPGSLDAFIPDVQRRVIAILNRYRAS